MRLAAIILLLCTLGLMAMAAYVPGDVWKLALYAGTVVAALTIALGLAAILEIFAEPRAAWIRSLLALASGGIAMIVSLRVRPGQLDDFALRNDEVVHTLTSVGALGFSIAAVVLGVTAVRMDKRGATVVGGLALLLTAVAMRGWLHHRT